MSYITLPLELLYSVQVYIHPIPIELYIQPITIEIYSTYTHPYYAIHSMHPCMFSYIEQHHPIHIELQYCTGTPSLLSYLHPHPNLAT